MTVFFCIVFICMVVVLDIILHWKEADPIISIKLYYLPCQAIHLVEYLIVNCSNNFQLFLNILLVNPILCFSVLLCTLQSRFKYTFIFKAKYTVSSEVSVGNFRLQNKTLPIFCQ